MKLGRTRIVRIFSVLAFLALTNCSCVFNPDPDTDTPPVDSKLREPTSPENVVYNLKVAFDQLNSEYYRDCLHDNYYYLFRSEVDGLDLRLSKSEDVRIIENIMNGSTKFVFNAVEHSRYLEYGELYPDIPEGATRTSEHPNEVWTIVNYSVDMQIFTRKHGDIEVSQFMNFKFRQDPNPPGYWTIVEWSDLSNQ